jgi:hypothetical protein
MKSKIKFDTEPKNPMDKALRYLSSLRAWSYHKDFQDVQTYLMFIGYPRSGHSLIGSLLDAHPQIVVAHELDALYYFKNGFSAIQVYYLILKNSMNFTRSGRQWMGYKYNVPNQWNGKYSNIKVIGDKCGGRSTRRLEQHDNVELLYKIEKQFGKPLMIIHVIRNPFDNITTMVRRSHERNGSEINIELLSLQIKHYFKFVKINNHLKNNERLRIVDIHFESFVADPKDSIKKLIGMFNLNCDDDFLRDCSSTVWMKPKKTRYSLDLWTPEIIQNIEEKLKEFDFLDHYRFNELDDA